MLVYVYDKTSNGIFNEYSCKLDMLHANLLSYMSTSSNDNLNSCIGNIKETVKSYIADVISNIRKFFSSPALGSDISSVYKTLSDNSRRYNTLEICDINMAIHLFDDYIDGLHEFVSIVHGVKPNEVDYGKMISKINTAIERDSKYIDLLFGGSENKRFSGSISDAMKQVEYLIDFIPQLETYKDKTISTIIDIDTSECHELVTCKINAIYLSVRSIMYFINKTVSELTETFFNVCINIKTKTSVSGEVEKPLSIF